MAAEAAVSETRPRGATYAVVLMVITGAVALALSLYWVFWGGGLAGAVVIGVLGIVYLYGSRALLSRQSWGWGSGVFTGVLFVFFGLFLLPLGGILIALAIAVILLLYRVRAEFGMVRYDAEEVEERKKVFETERTSNPKGLHCPHCGSTRLWLAPDGSAYCQDCRAGTISLVSTA